MLHVAGGVVHDPDRAGDDDHQDHHREGERHHVPALFGRAIQGAFDTIHRLKPIIIAEAHICTPEAICDLLPDYAIIGIGADVLCVHKDENPALHKDMEQLAEHMGARQVR